MCPRNWSGRPTGDMPIDLFRSVIDQAAGCAHFADLCLAGESLLHPQVFEAVEYVKTRGLTAYLQINGNPVDRHLARRICASGLDVLSFSIDGASAETYSMLCPSTRAMRCCRVSARIVSSCDRERIASGLSLLACSASSRSTTGRVSTSGR